MKKIIFLSLVGFLLFLFSCGNKADTDIVKDVPQKEFDHLKEQIVALNTTLPGKVIVETKAKWWKYLLTGLADAAGFFLAGGADENSPNKYSPVASACSVSTLVWTMLKSEKQTETKAMDDSSHLINDAEIALSHVEGMGLLHNRVILELHEDYGDEIFHMSPAELLPLVAEQVSVESGGIVDDTEVLYAGQQEMVENTVNAFVTSSTVDEFIGKLSLSFPEKVALLEIVRVIFEGFDSIDAISDNGNYNASVQTIISESGIPSEAKHILNSTASIANASARLWID